MARERAGKAQEPRVRKHWEERETSERNRRKHGSVAELSRAERQKEGAQTQGGGKWGQKHTTLKTEREANAGKEERK